LPSVAPERRADVIGDIADRRQNIRIMDDLDPSRIEAANAIDVSRLEGRRDKDCLP
jgi:hypothetical protein